MHSTPPTAIPDLMQYRLLGGASSLNPNEPPQDSTPICSLSAMTFSCFFGEQAFPEALPRYTCRADGNPFAEASYFALRLMTNATSGAKSGLSAGKSGIPLFSASLLGFWRNLDTPSAVRRE